MQLVQADQRHKLWIQVPLPCKDIAAPARPAGPLAVDLCSGCAHQGIHQPSFILALYNHTIPLDSRWNTAGLGWVPDLDEKTLKVRSGLTRPSGQGGAPCTLRRFPFSSVCCS